MLAEDLFKALSNVYHFSFKLQFYHWNVEGKNFKEYHELFGEMYDDVFGSIDTLAELIRTLDAYVPSTLSNIKDNSRISEPQKIMSSDEMINQALLDNMIVTASLLDVYRLAEQQSDVGISNFVQGRIQSHEKHKWFLRSFQKNQVS